MGTEKAAPVRPVAAIDCGTNSTRLLVLDGDGSRLDRRMRITRLGAGVDRTGKLDPEALARTLAVLAEYRQVLDGHGVTPDRARAAATSATRDAANSEEFLEAAEEVLGVRPEVIEGTEEGRLSYLGATASLPREEGPYLVVDIGGGSTELIVGRRHGGGVGEALLADEPAGVRSLDIGCVRITERFLQDDPPDEEEMAAARRAVGDLLLELLSGESDRASWLAGRRLIGLAGTVSAVTLLALGLSGFEEEKVNHARISRWAVAEVRARLAAVPLAERRAMAGMEPERADVIVGGALILEEVMDAFGYDELTASEADILDGIAFELLEEGR